MERISVAGISAWSDGGSLWVTQQAIGEFFGMTRAAVCLSLNGVDGRVRRRVVQKEGARLVSRMTLLYPPMAVLHAGRYRPKRKTESFVEACRAAGFECPDCAHLARKEHVFGELLSSVLDGFYVVSKQVVIGGDIADFVIQERSLVVEYDEKKHRYTVDSDRARDARMGGLGFTVIRVSEGHEGRGINLVLRHLFSTSG